MFCTYLVISSSQINFWRSCLKKFKYIFQNFWDMLLNIFTVNPYGLFWFIMYRFLLYGDSIDLIGICNFGRMSLWLLFIKALIEGFFWMILVAGPSSGILCSYSSYFSELFYLAKIFKVVVLLPFRFFKFKSLCSSLRRNVIPASNTLIG